MPVVSQVHLESQSHAELCGEGDAYGGPRPEEISESTGGQAKLVDTADRLGGAASGVGADVGDVAELRLG